MSTFVSDDLPRARDEVRSVAALVGNHVAEVLRNTGPNSLPPEMEALIAGRPEHDYLRPDRGLDEFRCAIGPWCPWLPLRSKSITWHWELMFIRPEQRTPDMIGQHTLLDAVADLVDAGRLRSTLTRQLDGFNAATLREAHAAVETGSTIGKVVVAR